MFYYARDCVASPRKCIWPVTRGFFKPTPMGITASRARSSRRRVGRITTLKIGFAVAAGRSDCGPNRMLERYGRGAGLPVGAIWRTVRGWALTLNLVAFDLICACNARSAVASTPKPPAAADVQVIPRNLMAAHTAQSGAAVFRAFDNRAVIVPQYGALTEALGTVRRSPPSTNRKGQGSPVWRSNAASDPAGIHQIVCG